MAEEKKDVDFQRAWNMAGPTIGQYMILPLFVPITTADERGVHNHAVEWLNRRITNRKLPRFCRDVAELIEKHATENISDG